METKVMGEDNPIGTLREFVSHIEIRGRKEPKKHLSKLLAQEFEAPIESSTFLGCLANLMDICRASLELIESDTMLSNELKTDAKDAISSISKALTITGLNQPWAGVSAYFERPAQRRLAWAEHTLSKLQSQQSRERGSALLLEDDNGALLLEGDDDKWEPLPIERESPEFQEAIVAVEEVVEEVAGSNGYAQDAPEEREQMLWSLNTGLDMLKKHRPTKAQVVSLLIRPIKYLAKRFLDASIGVAAKTALTKLLTFLSLGI